ncbi:putative membrane protein [Clostridioides difficile F480]|nr:putative membrane protein [Clostridioides difficile CD34]EQF72879.1 putative membrane protein [Clostridioides difficile CD211]EQK47541.1 putative membrane protein [Clostridioides difficile F480]EQK47716.1 putative membrane protein [Clostridioides difficile F200]EQK50005.1 putative membrane protein [Clostridioides difficile F525]EQK56516.1 putative membrane protein [Clostridioides difficile F548]ERM22000.1 putative membrane protein [Clostridioides difficile P41]
MSSKYYFLVFLSLITLETTFRFTLNIVLFQGFKCYFHVFTLFFRCNLFLFIKLDYLFCIYSC